MSDIRAIIPKVVNGEVIISNKDEYDEIRLPIDEMEYTLDNVYQKGRADAINEYKKSIIEDLTELKNKYFDIARKTAMPDRYTHLKKMDTVELIIEMIKLKE